MGKKVAVVGRIISIENVESIPDEYEIWTHVKGTLKFPRRDRIFEVHDETAWSRYLPQFGDIKAWGFSKNFHQIDVEKIESISKMGLTSSAAWIISQAVVEDVEEILVMGLPMKAGPEYLTQRPGVAFWLGIARGRGIRVDYKGDLLTEKQYPKDFV